MSVIFNNGKSIFIHVPKTGGSSIKKTFFKGGYGHYSLNDLLKSREDNFGSKLTEPPYNVFVIRRNPFDRLVSAWAFDRQSNFKGRKGLPEFDEFVFDFDKYVTIPPLRDFLKNKYHMYEKDVHFIPQHYFTHNTTDTLINTTYLKFERFEKDVKIFAKHLGVKDYKLQHWFKTERGEWIDYYTPEAASIVGKIYREDFNKYYPGLL